MPGSPGSLREAFIEVFHPANPQPFGSQALRHQGLSDGNDGVQWNAWNDETSTGSIITWLGVNLEGMQYRDWPIARLIQRELKEPKLIALRADLRQPEEIKVLWMAGCLGRRREPDPKLQGASTYSPTPIALSYLSQQTLASRRSLRHRAACVPQRDDEPSSGSPQGISAGSIWVSPHLRFHATIVLAGDWRRVATGHAAGS